MAGRGREVSAGVTTVDVIVIVDAVIGANRVVEVVNLAHIGPGDSGRSTDDIEVASSVVVIMGAAMLVAILLLVIVTVFGGLLDSDIAVLVTNSLALQLSELF